jgi:hypothetical protein
VIESRIIYTERSALAISRWKKHLGDRFSQYCILNEAGEVILEDKLPTTPKGLDEVFGKIPRSRIALETGTHSPWVRMSFPAL